MSLTAGAAATPAGTPQSEPEQFANLPIFELHLSEDPADVAAAVSGLIDDLSR